MKNIFTIFKKNQSGATAIEYGLVSSLIAISSIAAIKTTGDTLNQTFCNVGAALTTQFIPGCRTTLAADVTVDGPFSDTGIFLEAGQTVEITPEGNWTSSQYNNTTDRQDDPFNSMNHIDASEILSNSDYSSTDSSGGTYRVSAFGARIISENGQDYDTNYRHDPSLNMSLAQNGKVTITAENDGYLYIGIHDNYSEDNTYVGDTPNVNISLIH